MRDVFDNDELVASPDLAAADVEGWDSLGNVRLFMELERRCAVRFSAMEISSLENVGQLADLLEQKRFGSSSLSFSTQAGRELSDAELHWTTLARDFPELRLSSSDPALDGLEIEVRAFAPLGVGAEKSAEGFLPLICMELRLRNPTARKMALSTKLTLSPAQLNEHDARSSVIRTVRGPATLLIVGRAFVAAEQRATGTTEGSARLAVKTTIPARAERTVVFYLGAFDSNDAYAARYPSIERLVAGTIELRENLERDHAEFISLLQRTGDAEIDRALRWYVSSSILLTRGIQHETLTMGYREFNQRDSFWSSWIHLFFWPDLERQMIRESISAQKPDGQIPTTILPLIETDAIDITEYFVLRVLRYHHWYRDDAFLEEAWPSIRRAIAYLKSRDVDGTGLPRQESYWADWKDVAGVEGRAYAPHFALLWLAVLERSSAAARQIGQCDDAAAFDELYSQAFATIHRDLWNGSYYIDRWKDGKTSGVVLEDQVVGIFFGVVPQENARRIFDSLRANETPWGVRETFPYMPEPYEQPTSGGGHYHRCMST